MGQSTDDSSSANLSARLADQGQRIARSARVLANQPSRHKNQALGRIAEYLRARAPDILEANERDLERARGESHDEAFLDRLRLSETRIDKMASDVEAIAALDDPVGRVDEQWVRPNGIKVGRQRIPLGVLGMIYEARPNVTSDAAALCLKSGNGVLLKGGSAAFDSNRAIHRSIREAIDVSDLPDKTNNAVGFVNTTDRDAVGEMLTLDEHIDVVIPRGGPGLIQLVTEHAHMPVIKHDAGVCHIVVDGSAEPQMVDDIVLNAKIQRPSVCNAVETLLVLEDAVDPHLERVIEKLSDAGVTLFLDAPSYKAAERADLAVENLERADEQAYRREFLSLQLAVKVCEGLDEAQAHIAEYGSSHTEAIVTDDYSKSRRFVDEVDSSVVLVNASTRFSDGNQLGLGAEVGISTTRMHAYGPMGVDELTTTKFVVFGDGQIRE
jgi:glutamate-5-semialdehyde dehydrogenase